MTPLKHTYIYEHMHVKNGTKIMYIYSRIIYIYISVSLCLFAFLTNESRVESGTQI